GAEHEKGTPSQKGAEHEKGTPSQKGAEREKGAPSQKGAEQDKGVTPSQKGAEQDKGTGQKGTTTTQKGTSSSVSLTTEQRTKIRETVIRSSSSARVSSVNFTLRVGERVPRTVHVMDVPETLVEIVPQYRGKKFIIVREEIIIIDPDTLEIVAIIQV